MSTIDYSNKNLLIVENIKQSRDTLKLFTYGLGAIHVDITQNASKVVSMCEYTQYDIIFLGYDLGENKKNGQQLLEELRVKQLITRHCIIIMITAEVSQAMVLAALEHKPDEYLAKPYTLKDIKLRLQRSIAKKNAMAKIYHAMDDNDPQLVLSLTAQEIQKNSPYKTECLGIISRQYFELKQFDQAAKIYEQYKDVPNCQWAHIGLGKIALAHDNTELAQIHFQAIIDEHPLYLSAYDWLAKALELEGKPFAAEQVLETAIFISPRSVVRLKKYAQLCIDNESYEKATEAYYKTNELSHNSVHKDPKNAILFTESLLEYADKLDSQQTKNLSNKAQKALNTMTKDFNLPDLKIISNLLSSRLYIKVNTPSLAKPLIDSAMSSLRDHKQSLTNDNSLTISSSLLTLDRKEEAKSLLSALALSNPDDTNLLAKIESMSENPIDDNVKFEAQISLEMGMKLYKNKEYIAAIDKLNQALDLFPTHIGIKLNLLQVLILATKAGKARTQDTIQISKIFNEFDALNLETTNETFNRYSKLKKSFKQVKSINANH